MKKIAIFCGGPSSEHEISLNSTKTIYKFINKKKYEVVVCFISKNLNATIIKGGKLDFENIKPKTALLDILKELKRENYFAMLAGLHGEFVEDGKLQTLLEYFKVPYSGSNPQASALSMDKFRSTLLIQTLKDIQLPKTFIVDGNNGFPKSLSLPAIVKPNALGSSVGISIIKTLPEFKSVINKLKKKFFDQEILVQELLNGVIELSCGVLQRKNNSFKLLPPIEIVPKKNDFFDYDSKYLVGGSEEITPPISINKNFCKKISLLSTKIHSLLGLKTYSRSDFLIKDNKIYYLETNTLPGMTPTSLLPQEAKAIGLSFPMLIDFIIENS